MRVAVVFALLVILPLPAAAAGAAPGVDGTWDGRRIMDEVFRRHHPFPHVYEEQTMILTDRAGNRNSRKLRRFSRLEADGTFRFLLVFDDPAPVRGVALLAVRPPEGEGYSGIYLPAFGMQMKASLGEGAGGSFLGTDFTAGDLAAELQGAYRYRRAADRTLGRTVCLVVEVLPQDDRTLRTTGYSLRRHFVTRDTFFVIRTDYYDRRGRLAKTQTLHDLKRLEGEMWRANMIRMKSHKKRHETLIKIDRRIFSEAYVSREMFSPDWVLEGRHLHRGRRVPGASTAGDETGGRRQTATAEPEPGTS